MRDQPAPTGPVMRDLGVGLSVLALGAVVLWRTTAIPVSPIYARVGPTLFPWMTGGGLALLGIGLCIVALRGGWSHTLEDVPTDPFNPRAFGLLMLGLAVNVALIDSLGFVIASTIQFVLICAAFSSTAYFRNAAIGLAVCFGSFLLFGELLGVNIGAGILEGLL